MFKKFDLIDYLILITAILFPFYCLGAISYERNPSGFKISNPVSFEISNKVDSGGFWNLYFQDDEIPEFNSTDCVVASETSHTFIENLPLSRYYEVGIHCWEGENCSEPMKSCLDEEGSQPVLERTGDWIFEVVEAKKPFMIDFTSDIATESLAFIGRLFTDLSPVVILIIGLPLAFWGIGKIIGFLRSY
jgi:hypothetical protein